MTYAISFDFMSTFIINISTLKLGSGGGAGVEGHASAFSCVVATHSYFLRAAYEVATLNSIILPPVGYARLLGDAAASLASLRSARSAAFC